jgi:hypothetical protein
MLDVILAFLKHEIVLGRENIEFPFVEIGFESVVKPLPILEEEPVDLFERVPP